LLLLVDMRALFYPSLLSRLLRGRRQFRRQFRLHTLASAIRHWNFRGIVVKQFWGLPYAMAALSTVTRISDRTSLLAISVIASFAAEILAWRL
jgi:hypothetical protein